MNLKAITIVCLICSTVCCNSNTSKVSAQDSPEWLILSKEAQERVVNDYVDAFDEFAQVMPKFGQDTEAQWAADTVHAMALSIKQNKYPFTKSLAMISQMQNYTGYGMAYFNAIIGAYSEPQLARYAKNIIHNSDSLYSSLKDFNFEDVRKLIFFQATSDYNMQLFNTLNRINNGRSFNREIYLSMYSVAFLDSISQLKDYSDIEIFKVSSILESFSSFQMICPLLAIFSGTKEKYDSNIGVITEAAKHIDSQSTQVFQALNEGKKVEIMPDTEFEAWMITTNQHKVKLLKLLTKFVKEWNPTE